MISEAGGFINFIATSDARFNVSRHPNGDNCHHRNRGIGTLMMHVVLSLSKCLNDLCKKDIYKEQLFLQTEPETRFFNYRCHEFEQNGLPEQFHQTRGQTIFFQDEMELLYTDVLNLTRTCDHWMKPLCLEQHLNSSSQFDDSNHKTRRSRKVNETEHFKNLAKFAHEKKKNAHLKLLLCTRVGI